MLILTIVVVLFSILYNFLLLDYWRVWNQAKNVNLLNSISALPYLSVVIVSRNESQLFSCIQSIIGGSYPIDKYEILLVDDHSEDGSIEAILSLQIQNLKVIHLKDFNIPDRITSFKKYGQQQAIAQARYDWIVTTDGDCICPSEWLYTIAQYTERYGLITAPIKITGDRTWLSQMQQCDLIATMIGTNYGICKKYWYSANAANMAFEKQLYQKYKKEAEGEDYASGDDVFLIQFAAQYKTAIAYVHDQAAIVETPPEDTLSSFFNQRLRWASKTKGYTTKGLKILIYLIGFYNLMLFVVLILGLATLSHQIIMLAIFAYLSKCIAEYILFSRSKIFFDVQYNFVSGLILSGMHILYILVVGFASVFITNYKWKGREVR